MDLAELDLIPPAHRGSLVRRLRAAQDDAWLPLLDEAILASRRMDPEGLVCAHTAALILGVTPEWFRWMLRRDALRGRYTRFPWRSNGRPPVPASRSAFRRKAAMPPVTSAWCPDGAEFHHDTLHLDLVRLLDLLPTHPCTTLATSVAPYARFAEHLIPGPGYPVILAPWEGGLFVVNGWGVLADAVAAGIRGVPGIVAPATLTAAVGAPVRSGQTLPGSSS